MSIDAKGPRNWLRANIPMDWTFLIVKIVKSNSSMKSYGKLIILKSTGLWIEDHECRIICLG